MNRTRTALLVTAGFAAALAILLSRPGAETRIRREWTDLLASVSRERASGLLAEAQAAREVARHFSTNAVIRTGEPYPITVPAREVPPLLVRAWRTVQSVSVHDQGVEIELAPGRRAATMRAALTIVAQHGEGAGEWNDVYRVQWLREEDNWRIAELEPEPAETRPSARP